MVDRVNWKHGLILIAYVVLVGVIAIFAHSGFQGDHGLAAFREAGEQERALQAELHTVRAERTDLDNKVLRLSERYLDLDLLDERARAVLGLVREDELVVR